MMPAIPRRGLLYRLWHGLTRKRWPSTGHSQRAYWQTGRILRHGDAVIHNTRSTDT
jgi:hypothetical protein